MKDGTCLTCILHFNTTDYNDVLNNYLWLQFTILVITWINSLNDSNLHVKIGIAI